jgi:hypothetical protein
MDGCGGEVSERDNHENTKERKHEKRPGKGMFLLCFPPFFSSFRSFVFS